MDIDTNVIAALVSAGVSLLFSIVYWFGKKIYVSFEYRKKVKEYKQYAIEFLDLCIKLKNREDIVFEGKSYKYYHFNISRIKNDGDRLLPVGSNKIDTILIVAISLYFLNLKYRLSQQCKANVVVLLKNFYPKLLISLDIQDLFPQEYNENYFLPNLGLSYNENFPAEILNTWSTTSLYSLCINNENLYKFIVDINSGFYDKYIENTVKDF